MKKKILSTLIAACLFVGMAVPAVMAASSDVAGDPKKVTKITTNKSSYDVEGTKDFSEEISVFENNTKLVLDQQHIRYKLEAITGDYGDFRIEGSKVTCVTAGATGKLTIYDNYNQSSTNARVTVNIKGVAAPGSIIPETFSFVDSYKKLPITNGNDNSETQTLKIKAHPKGASFKNAVSKPGGGTYLEDALTQLKDQIAFAMFGGSTGGTTAIANGVFTDGKNAVGANAEHMFEVTIADMANAAAAASVTMFGKTYNFTPTGTTTGDAAKAFANVFNAGDKKINGKLYTCSVASDVVKFEAVDAFDAPALVVGTTFATTGGDGLSATVTASTAGETIAAATSAKVVFNFSNAIPKKTDKTEAITIGGISVVPGAQNQTIESQLELWARNANLNNYFVRTGTPSGAATAVVSGRTVTITNTATGPVTPDVAVPTHEFVAVAAGSDVVAGANARLPYPIQTDINADDSTIIDITIPYQLLETLPPSMTLNINKPVNTPKMTRLDGKYDGFTAGVNLQAVNALRANGIQLSQYAYDVKVGQKIDFGFTYYPTDANVGLDAERTVRPTANNTNAYQYAVIDGDKILGVNSNGPGSTRAAVILTGTSRNPINTEYRGDATAMVAVKPTDFNADANYGSKVNVTKATIKAGGVQPLTITGIPDGVTVKWTHKDDGIIGLTNDNKATTAVIGKKPGVNTVTATLSNGETFKVEITVEAAAAVKPTAPGTNAGTDVPQTGDSLFANLFN